MKTLFVYPESYLNVGIPGGITIMSAILKKHGHEVDLFDTSFNMNKATRLKYGESVMTHAMLFTGVDIINNKPK